MHRDYINDSLAAALRDMVDVYGDQSSDAIERAKRALKDAGYIDWPSLPEGYRLVDVSMPYKNVDSLADRQRRARSEADDFANRKRLAKEASEALWSVFVWSQTPEGDDFWSSVTNRLEQIAETGDHTQ